jgi:hypothetical protein
MPRLPERALWDTGLVQGLAQRGVSAQARRCGAVRLSALNVAARALDSGPLARSSTGCASSSNFSRVIVLRKSRSFIRHSTFIGASGMLLSSFFSCASSAAGRLGLQRRACNCHSKQRALAVVRFGTAG